ncbi:MAG TPA: hypothetical protein VFQ77_05605 [Pseudonocardiaceae bacterium]|nr:hypothetical protein [Pseudonocardiaceae bacterium]
MPGFSRITEPDLQAGGGRRELHTLYSGLSSGRIVVVGAPGAGKSGAAILLLLDALAHRDGLDTTERARVPVPVLFTTYDWDPRTTSAQDWLRDQLVATYPLFAHRGGRAEAAGLVAARDKVALLLDGLDEMDETLRSAALQALSEAPFRVVVLSRSEEMVRAASTTWLVGALGVHLHDVTGAEAADYLERARRGPPPARWADLLTHLREHPDGVLAKGLSTPLTLTLLRDTYQLGDDVSDLLDPTRYPTRAHIEQHLIARILPAAYAPRPGRPPPRYTEIQARRTLICIAQSMGKQRDLAWWHIPRWAPATSRVLTTSLVCGLAVGLVFGFLVVFGLWVEEGSVVEPLLGFGSMGGDLVFGVGLQLGVGLVFGLGGRGGGEPQRVRIANWRGAISSQTLRVAVGSGLGVGLVAGPALAFGVVYEPELDPVARTPTVWG